MFFKYRLEKKQATIVIDIAREHLRNLSDLTPIYSEEDKRFIWNVYSLEQFINKNSYWEIKKGQLSPNDSFLYHIIQYLTTHSSRLKDLPPENIGIYENLLKRLQFE
jgi:hypothetical protein